MKNRVFIHSPELERLQYPPDCPFKASRAAKTRRTVARMGLLGGADRAEMAPVAATRDELEKFHAPGYLDALAAAEDGHLPPDSFLMGLGTPDCPVFKGMYQHAALAAGGTLMGARLILEGRAGAVFNPAGGFHHAGPSRAAGFCYVNDVVLAALAFTAAGGRVCFLDLDAHHGDGVQHAFYGRPDVLAVSLHESGATLFPGTGSADEIGTGAGEGYTVNLPLPAGAGDREFETAFREAAWPVIEAYDPDALILELGMDGLAGDPLAHLRLTNNALADATALVMTLDKPVLATGGGGYQVENTVRGWALAWSVLCGAEDRDLAVGMGGVMLETTEWRGGLRDRMLPADGRRRREADREVIAAVETVRSRVFPIHGLGRD